jgi:hypothetical protein
VGKGGDMWRVGEGGREGRGGGQGRFRRISHSMTRIELTTEGTYPVCRTGTSLGGLKVEQKKKIKC